jgi:hypothetical protein
MLSLFLLLFVSAVTSKRKEGGEHYLYSSLRISSVNVSYVQDVYSKSSKKLQTLHVRYWQKLPML